MTIGAEKSGDDGPVAQRDAVGTLQRSVGHVSMAHDVVGDMVRFLIRWSPFDDGDDEIFPTFGVEPRIFYLRMTRLLDADPELAGSRTAVLRTYCLRKAGIVTAS